MWERWVTKRTLESSADCRGHLVEGGLSPDGGLRSRGGAVLFHTVYLNEELADQRYSVCSPPRALPSQWEGYRRDSLGSGEAWHPVWPIIGIEGPVCKP